MLTGYYNVHVLSFQAKEFGRKAVVASEGNSDDTLSRSIIEFMKNCERVPIQNIWEGLRDKEMSISNNYLPFKCKRGKFVVGIKEMKGWQKKSVNLF